MTHVASKEALQQKANQLIASCSQRVTELRGKVCRMSRRTVLSQELCRRGARTDYIFKPSEMRSFLGFAQIMQNTAFLLTYVTENPDILANAVFATHKNFAYMINCVIPSAFAYFSSMEHLDTAIKFYKCVGRKGPAKKVIPILMPLFQSHATLRFTECVMTRAMGILALDENIYLQRAKPAMFINRYIEFFLECIRICIPLLPHPLLDMCRFLFVELQWQSDDFYRLFFDGFLRTALSHWIRTLRDTTLVQIMSLIVNRVVDCNEHAESVLQVILNSTSVCDMPMMYKPFGHNWLDFYVCGHDMQMIAGALEEIHQMPDTVTISELMSIPHDRIFHWYKCQVFIEGELTNDSVHQCELFGREQDMNGVETMIVENMYEHELQKWMGVVQTREKVAIECVLRRYVESARVKRLEFMEIYQSLLYRFDTMHLERWVYMLLLECTAKEWLKPYEPTLRTFDTHFECLLRKLSERGKRESCSALEDNKRLKVALVNSMRELARMDSVRWCDLFPMLIRVVRQLIAIQEEEGLTDDIYRMLFERIRKQGFLSTFIVINCSAMKSQTFVVLLDNCENFA